MTRHRHPILERIVRRLEPSAENFAAAAALYCPDLMLQLAEPSDGLDPSSAPYDSRRQAERHVPGAESHQRGGTLIARIWRGAVRKHDSDAYAAYMRDTGVAGYASTPGNRGVWMLRRDTGERTEFVMFTLWDSVDAVKSFAGTDYESAVFYPEDDQYLVERDLTTTHYLVETEVLPPRDAPPG